MTAGHRLTARFQQPDKLFNPLELTRFEGIFYVYAVFMFFSSEKMLKLVHVPRVMRFLHCFF
jgi:hypothetical protein